MSDEKQYLKNEKNYDSDSGEYADNGDLQSCKPISGSYFDLTFKPTSKITYKTILPQVNFQNYISLPLIYIQYNNN